MFTGGIESFWGFKGGFLDFVHPQYGWPVSLQRQLFCLGFEGKPKGKPKSIWGSPYLEADPCADSEISVMDKISKCTWGWQHYKYWDNQLVNWCRVLFIIFVRTVEGQLAMAPELLDFSHPRPVEL